MTLAEWTLSPAEGSWVTQTFPFNGSMISNYGDLRFEFAATVSGIDPEEQEFRDYLIGWLELEVPGVP